MKTTDCKTTKRFQSYSEGIKEKLVAVWMITQLCWILCFQKIEKLGKIMTIHLTNLQVKISRILFENVENPTAYSTLPKINPKKILLQQP